MGEVLAFIGLGAILAYLAWQKGLLVKQTTLVQSSTSAMLPAGMTPTALGIAPELQTVTEYVQYGVDPQYAMAFPVNAASFGKLRVQILSDPVLIAMSVQLNPEAARWAAARKG